MTAHITKTWLEDGKLITQGFEEKDIYKREWVGLTNGEIHNAYIEAANQTLRPQDERIVLAFARALEAKLKEKNS